MRHISVPPLPGVLVIATCMIGVRALRTIPPSRLEATLGPVLLQCRRLGGPGNLIVYPPIHVPGIHGSLEDDLDA